MTVYHLVCRVNIAGDIVLFGTPSLEDAKEPAIRSELSRLDKSDEGPLNSSLVRTDWWNAPRHMDSWQWRENSCHLDVLLEVMYWIFRRNTLENADLGPFLNEVSLFLNLFMCLIHISDNRTFFFH
jgi:hypothetical protein